MGHVHAHLLGADLASVMDRGAVCPVEWVTPSGFPERT